MANNPVQIVLNDKDFHSAPDPKSFPRNKDFFTGKDAEFAEHRKSLISSVELISAAILSNDFGPATYVNVKMNELALAKSYRPNDALFTEDLFPCVGAAEVGSIFYRAPQIHLERLAARIASAEDEVETRISKKTGEPYDNVSKERAEVGAIESISIVATSSKRKFSAVSAVELFKSRKVVSGYIVELFETPSDSHISDDVLGQDALEESLMRMFMEFGSGTRAFLIPPVGRTPLIELQLTEAGAPAFVENLRVPLPASLRPEYSKADIDLSADRHEMVLSKLSDHPLVRRIDPPLMLEALKDTLDSEIGQPVVLPEPVQDARYPIVGVIDTGIAKCLESWTVGRFDYLESSECDEDHGTKVAGIVNAGFLLNDSSVRVEHGGCMLYDGALFPVGDFLHHYPRGFTDFLEEVEQCVSEAVKDHDIRVFNLSINAVSDVERASYSLYAARLDEISDKHGVIFVNSVGNLTKSQRSNWPSSPRAAVQYFADRTDADPIQKPSESVRSISVGALNPPGAPGLTGAPTTYTRRGPSLQVGVKPDVAAFGGEAISHAGDSSGLISIANDGSSVPVAGTSFAAPLIARTLAELDSLTQGGLSTEALRGMLIHNTTVPDALKRVGLKQLARQFTGFGQPGLAIEMVETSDHEVTLVFQSRLTVGSRNAAILRFPFDWPSCLVGSNGSCSGTVRMTLVGSPPLDPTFGAEFVRVNLEAKLRQYQNRTRKDGLPSYASQVDPRYSPKFKGMGASEKSLIDHGLKWWPSKQYESNLISRGESSNWRMEVESLVRSEANFPAEGIPFAVIMTIQDSSNKLPVFGDMRRSLQASAATAVDIRNSVRLRT